jgi:hypothetical protein
MAVRAVASADGRTRATAAAAIALAGSIGLLVAGWLWPQMIPLVMGVAGLAIAAGLWRGSDSARIAALPAGLLMIVPGLFGAYSLKVTAETWLAVCADRGTMATAIGAAQSVATSALWSYPSDFCVREDWVTHWGIGLGLTGAGIAGVALFVVVLATAPRVHGA